MTTTPTARRLRASVVLDAVADAYEVTRDDLVGPCREQRFVTARWAAMYLLSTQCGLSLNGVGHWLQRDHSTVLHGLRVVEADAGRREAAEKLVENL